MNYFKSTRRFFICPNCGKDLSMKVNFTLDKKDNNSFDPDNIIINPLCCGRIMINADKEMLKIYKKLADKGYTLTECNNVFNDVYLIFKFKSDICSNEASNYSDILKETKKFLDISENNDGDYIMVYGNNKYTYVYLHHIAESYCDKRNIDFNDNSNRKNKELSYSLLHNIINNFPDLTGKTKRGWGKED